MFTYMVTVLRLMVLHVLPFYTYKFKIFFFNLLNKTFSYIIKLG